MYPRKFKRLKILFCLILICIFCFSFSVSVFARAGGGGSSGGGGGSSSGGGTSSHHTRYPGQKTNPIAGIFHGIIFVIVGSGGVIVFAYRSRKARSASIRLMKQYEELGVNWDYKEVQEHVEKAYFVIQEAWRRCDTSYADGYLSQELAQKWNTKLQWTKLRNEEIVQKNVKLLSAMPVGVHDESGEDKDRIWYLIHGKMIGYYRDKTSGRIVKGTPKPEEFYEYWLWVRENNRWVLHEIRQKDEMDIMEFLV